VQMQHRIHRYSDAIVATKFLKPELWTLR